MNLKDFDHLLNDKRIQFKIEKPDGCTEVVIISYMIADNELWKIPNSFETRGIAFDKNTGECLARPFEKFFNLNETEFTQYDHLKNTCFQFDIFEKLDGCLDEHTLIETEDGTKTIREICETNYDGFIMGYDEINECFIQTRIEGRSVKESSSSIWFEIELENGEKLKLTNNHKVWSNTRKCYIQVADLMIDEDVIFKKV